MKNLAPTCLMAVLIASCATAPAPKPTVEVDAGAFVVTLDEKPEVVVFVSTTGEYADRGYDECAADTKCRARFNALSYGHKVETIEPQTAPHQGT